MMYLSKTRVPKKTGKAESTKSSFLLKSLKRKKRGVGGDECSLQKNQEKETDTA